MIPYKRIPTNKLIYGGPNVSILTQTHHGSPEAHLRATLYRMKPERRMETLRRLLAEEIAAAQARAHEGVV